MTNDTKTLTGWDAIEAAEQTSDVNLTLRKYADPVDEAREVDIDEARKIAREDPSLIWAEVSTADRHYGFTHANHSGEPAWFRTREAARRFAVGCGEPDWEIEETSDYVDAALVLDPPEESTSATNATITERGAGFPAVGEQVYDPRENAVYTVLEVEDRIQTSDETGRGNYVRARLDLIETSDPTDLTNDQWDAIREVGLEIDPSAFATDRAARIRSASSLTYDPTSDALYADGVLVGGASDLTVELMLERLDEGARDDWDGDEEGLFDAIVAPHEEVAE